MKIEVNSYHMTQSQAQTVAAGDENYRAKPYPDRHGDHTNNFTPNLTTWGVWDEESDHWVFVHHINVEWRDAPQHIFDLAKANGYPVRVSGEFPFERREICTTDSDEESMYDHFCP